MIQIENLTKTYSRGKKALDSLSVVFPPGVHGLLGPNGAGKTTLMRVLATLLQPTVGKVSVFGHDLIREKQSIRAILGYLPQEFGFYPELTATETLDYLALLSGMRSSKERAIRIQSVLELVNLWTVQGERVGTFSGGMKQRLGIAQMLLTNPKLIIVDEPTAGLDPEERVSFRNLIGRLFAEDKDRVVIISTHIVEDLASIASNIVVLNQGQLVYSGSTQQLARRAAQLVYAANVSFEQFKIIQQVHLVTWAQQGISGDTVSVRFIKQDDFIPPEASLEEPNLEDGYLALLGREAYHDERAIS